MVAATVATAASSSGEWPAASVAAICWSGSSASMIRWAIVAQVGTARQLGEHVPVILGEPLVQSGQSTGHGRRDLWVLVAEGDQLEQVRQALTWACAPRAAPVRPAACP